MINGPDALTFVEQMTAKGHDRFADPDTATENDALRAELGNLDGPE